MEQVFAQPLSSTPPAPPACPPRSHPRHSPSFHRKSHPWDSNPRPHPYQGCALPTELGWRLLIHFVSQPHHPYLAYLLWYSDKAPTIAVFRPPSHPCSYLLLLVFGYMNTSWKQQLRHHNNPPQSCHLLFVIYYLPVLTKKKYSSGVWSIATNPTATPYSSSCLTFGKS